MAERKRAATTEKTKSTRKPARKTTSKTASKVVPTKTVEVSAAPEVKKSTKGLSSIQSLFKSSWAHFKLTVGSYLKIVVVGFALVLAIAVVGLLLGLPLMISSGGSASNLLDAPSILQIIGIALVVLWAIASFVALIAYVLLMPIAGVLILDRKVNTSVESLFKKSLPMLWPYFRTTLLVGAVTLGGWMCFLFPGLLFLFIFSPVAYVVVLEGKRGPDALYRTYQLVKPFFWHFLLRAFILQLLMYIGSSIFDSLSEQMEIFSLLSWAFSIVGGWFSQAYMYLLYKELRANASAAVPSLGWVWVITGIGWAILIGLIIAVASGNLAIPEFENAMKMMNAPEGM